MVVESGTWHHGLMARWWAEFVAAEPEELDYFRAAIRKFGEPALDLGCGAGRILIPMLVAGFDVDGSDVSTDMVAEARALAEKNGFSPGLTVQPMRALQLKRKYRTIYMCGAFGIGSRRGGMRVRSSRRKPTTPPGEPLLRPGDSDGPRGIRLSGHSGRGRLHRPARHARRCMVAFVARKPV